MTIRISKLIKEESLRDVTNKWFDSLGNDLESAIKKKSKKYVEKTSVLTSKTLKDPFGSVYVQVNGFTAADLTFRTEIYIFLKNGVTTATVDTSSAAYKGKNEQKWNWGSKVDANDIIKHISEWLDLWLQAN